MTRNTGCALLAALTATLTLIVSVLFFGTDRTTQGPRSELADKRPRADPASAGRWVGTWSTSMVTSEPGTDRGYPRMSLRNVVRISVGGTRARIHLSNTFGRRSLTISHATVAIAALPGSPDALPGTMRRLTFSGDRSVRIPPGRSVSSDPVRLKVPNAVDLLVTSHSPSPWEGVTYHPRSRQTSYLAVGNHVDDLKGTAFIEQTPYWRLLSRVDVWTTNSPGTVVALGDSITDGVRSTVGTNRRWTDFLAIRLMTTKGAPLLGVCNQGISGNRLLADGVGRFAPNGQSALNRAERDAFSVTGATVLVIALGVNDILKDPAGGDPEAILRGLRTLTNQGHTHGLRVVGATLTPFAGHRGHTPRREATRQRINAEIRSGSVFDSVVDFDAALRDPAAPDRLRPQYDSGDHLHPSDAGNRAMAHALDLTRLQTRAPAAA